MVLPGAGCALLTAKLYSLFRPTTDLSHHHQRGGQQPHSLSKPAPRLPDDMRLVSNTTRTCCSAHFWAAACTVARRMQWSAQAAAAYSRGATGSSAWIQLAAQAHLLAAFAVLAVTCLQGQPPKALHSYRNRNDEAGNQFRLHRRPHACMPQHEPAPAASQSSSLHPSEPACSALSRSISSLVRRFFFGACSPPAAATRAAPDAPPRRWLPVGGRHSSSSPPSSASDAEGARRAAPPTRAPRMGPRRPLPGAPPAAPAAAAEPGLALPPLSCCWCCSCW